MGRFLSSPPLRPGRPFVSLPFDDDDDVADDDDAGGETSELEPSHAMAIFR